MRTTIIRAVIGFSLLSCSAAFAAPFAYTVDGDTTPSPLYKIDLATNAFSSVGVITGHELESLSFGSGQVLYGVDNGSGELITVDVNTAAPTVVGPLGVSVTDPGMAYCSDNGIMYLASEGGEFYSIDLATGTATLLGSDGNYRPTGMTCTTGGILYAIDDDQDSLFTVDRNTGMATLVGPLGVDIADGGLGRNGSQLLMVADESPTNLYEVNSATGAASIIVELDSGNLGLEGLSVDTEGDDPGNAAPALPATAIPTVSTWGLLLMISGMMLMGLFAFNPGRRD